MLRPAEISFRATFASPRGTAEFITTDRGICALLLPGTEAGWLDRWIAATLPDATIVDGADGDPFVGPMRACMAAYFAGRQSSFDLPLDLRGTALQQSVWRQIARIPFGATQSFATVASAIGGTATPRAVGQAAAASALPILVPSHRVVDGEGTIAGRGAMRGIHRWLLAHEGLLPADDEFPARWYRRVQASHGPVYIGTTRTRAYCLPACINVQEDRAWVPRIFRSIQEAREAGFSPCNTCRPDHVIRTGPLPA